MNKSTDYVHHFKDLISLALRPYKFRALRRSPEIPQQMLQLFSNGSIKKGALFFLLSRSINEHSPRSSAGGETNTAQ